MNKLTGHTRWRSLLSTALLLAGFVTLLVHLALSAVPPQADRQAEKVGKILSERLADLGERMDAALAAAPEFDTMPEDMVLYRYRNDSLLWWRGQFPIGNDEIRQGSILRVSPAMQRNVRRPLASLGPEPQWVNYGTKWYVVRAQKNRQDTVIGGIEVWDSYADDPAGRFNPNLPLTGAYSIQPLSYGEGAPVMLGERPIFLLLSLTASEAARPSEWLLYLSLVFFLAGLILFVRNKRSMLRWGVALLLLWSSLIYTNHHAMTARHGTLPLFSPDVYAGEVLPLSLGGLLLVNLGWLLTVFFTYLMRRRWDAWAEKRALRRYLLCGGALLGMVALCTYIHLIFRDIVTNSNISLRLTDIDAISIYTLLVYLSLMTLLCAVPMLLHFVLQLLPRRPGKIWQQLGRLLFCTLAAVYFVTAAGWFSLRKEALVASTWANRLAMDRDIDLEARLLSVEDEMAQDPMLSGLSQLPTANHIVLRRLSEQYLKGVTKRYSLSVYLFNEQDWNDPAGVNLYNERVRSSEPIEADSHFLCGTDMRGRVRYSGVFDYFSRENGRSRILICLEPKNAQAASVFQTLLGLTDPGELNLPPLYSYARYYDRVLTSCEGTYSYPTRITSRPRETLPIGGSRYFPREGYVHFLTHIADKEYITVSRPEIPAVSFVVVGAFLLVVIFLVLLIFFPVKLPRQEQARTYYKTRISTVILLSLALTLISMAAISVYFVYKRSRDDRSALMRGRINAVQTLMQSKLRYVSALEDVSASEVAAVMEDVGSTLRLDLILYQNDGRAYQSTTYEIFERMLLGTRINEKALEAVCNGNLRFFINREKIAGQSYYALYAPLINQDGQMLGIICSPYSEDSYGFRNDASIHILSVLTLLMILLFIARFFAARYVDRMLTPIVAMGRKMSRTDLENLEYIVYDRDDEVTTLVTAYNRMVKALSDSTRSLAQAERDKAWSEMARQVAHEIKNPLTPIKLRLQMLIRMKESGNPAWTDKFDEVSAVVLEHIDILADTANEFSTFARLYSEEPVEFDLDALIQEEVALFEGREGIHLAYIGLSGARISGPKPQLTRVLVNLITNAIQAVEGQEEAEILLSLRNAQRDGFYDIVVEDNGPGVREENRSKLFTPEFTTKSSGSGLGLAICRNIVEKCGGDIQYSRSFSLGGACFTVRYPKLR